MSNNKDNNEKYKLIVIAATGFFLLWIFADFQEKIFDYSDVLGFIIGPIFIFIIIIIMRAIWPEL